MLLEGVEEVGGKFASLCFFHRQFSDICPNVLW